MIPRRVRSSYASSFLGKRHRPLGKVELTISNLILSRLSSVRSLSHRCPALSLSLSFSLCLPSFFLPGIVKRHPAKRAAENEVLETTRCRLFIKKMQMSSKWGEENSKEATRNTSCASRIHRVVCRFTINYLNFVVNTVEVVAEELLTLCTRRKIAL